MSYNVIVISLSDLYGAGAPLIGTMLSENGHSVKVIPHFYAFSQQQRAALIDKFVVNENQCVCISITHTFGNQYGVVLREIILQIRAKFPNLNIVIGGKGIVETFPGVTYFIGNDKENAALDYINAQFDKPTIKGFNFLESKTNYELVDSLPKCMMFLEVSRNCLFNCAFCTYEGRGKPNISKSADLLVNEIEEFYAKFKTPIILLLCNTFNESVKKIELMMEVSNRLSFVPQFFAYTRLDLYIEQPEIVKEFYRKYVKYVVFGVESFKPETCRVINKSTNGIKMKKQLVQIRSDLANAFIQVNLIIGLPNESFQEVFDNTCWLREQNLADRIAVSVLRILDVTNEKNESSLIDKNPELFGYTILSTNKGVKHWQRDDGYTYDQANLDLGLLSLYLGTCNFFYAMFCDMMGEDVSKIGSGEAMAIYNRLSTQNSQQLFDRLMA